MMVNNSPSGAVAQYFDAMVTKHGSTPESCDWGSRESQRKRFQVLCEVCNLEGQSVLDVGCGPAYLSDYLAEYAPSTRYMGYDISPKMVAAALERKPGIDVRYGDILTLSPSPSADIVMASGIMFWLGKEPLPWFRLLIAKLFGCAAKALAFNCLSSWGPNPVPDEFYPDPAETLLFCRTLTPWVCLRHDYHVQDFTIYLFKQKQ